MNSLSEALLWISALTLIAAGTAGTVLPLLPGTPFVLLGILLAAWIDDFSRIGWPTLVLCGIFTAASIAIDFIASAAGAKRVGASSLAVYGALIGAIAGLFFGLIGILCGPFLGAAGGELLAQRDVKKAGVVGLATWMGLIVGGALKVAIVFSMIGTAIIAYLL